MSYPLNIPSVMKPKTLVFVSSFLFAAHSATAVAIVDYQFNDDNGTSLDSAVNAGSDSGTWNFGSIRFNTLSPAEGSWGKGGTGAATDPTVNGTAGDYMLVDSLTLTAVPETGAYPLFAGILALAWVSLRRRQ